MQKTISTIAIIALFSFVGCVPSLHSLYTDEDVIFNPNLVGLWAEESSSESWCFSKYDEKSYCLVYTDCDGKKGEFLVHLVSIEGNMFLDLYPSDPDLPYSAFYQVHLIPAHTFIFVKQIEPTLQMAIMHPDGLEQLLDKDPNAIQCEKIEDKILLTASAKELQAFLVKNIKTDKFFMDRMNLKRKTTKEQKNIKKG